MGKPEHFTNALNRKEIVFHNRQRIGDMLMFTCAIRDFKKQFPNVRINVIATAKHIFDHNPYIDRKLQQTDENLVKIGPTKGTNQSNRIDWHFANAYRISMEENLNCHIEQGESRPDIWLTQAEWDAPRIMDNPYWLICTNGEKGWGCKMYPHERFQEFVDKVYQIAPNVKFVHIGTREDDAPRLTGPNVIDYIGKTQDGKTGIRDLFKLFLNAEGSIGLVSFHMHLSAALYKPAIVIAGAREPVSFTRYQGHAYLSTEGMLPCAETTACWACNIDKCTNLVIGEGMEHKGQRIQEKVPRCVDMIPSDDLVRAFQGYYIGGRLSYDKPSPKPIRFDNIVMTPVEPDEDDSAFSLELFEKFGAAWSFSSIPAECWRFISGKIKKHDVKTVLEFGAGISTLLMNDMGLKVVTYETNQRYIDAVKKIMPDADVRLWDGQHIDPDKELFDGVDLAFVDGPPNGEKREWSTQLAAELARMVIVHDGGRPFEMKWQNRYLREKFDGPDRGGKRSHFWIKKSFVSPTYEMGDALPEKREIVQPGAISQGKQGLSARHVKLVSTARGWGGCSRSITTIMSRLLKEGHAVEFIPFRNEIGSREFREWASKQPGLIISGSYDAIKGPCDVLFVYADDFVWEFPKPEIAEIFHGCKAHRKIMMVNYRRGKIGELDWTREWDKYMFLNSAQEENFLSLYNPEDRPETKVLPPCTELEPFFARSVDYDTCIGHALRIVRHNSQGDTKFTQDDGPLIDEILDSRTDCMIDMLPGPSWYSRNGRFFKHKKTADPEVIADFLSKGNLFWYSLPLGYMDMGPRVIIEAMAAGLPILADNWGGAIDRVSPECGWLCNDKREHIEIIKSVTNEELREKGQAARERALSFRPEKWIQEILT